MIVVEPPVGYSLVDQGAVHCYNGPRDDPRLAQHLAHYERIPAEIRNAFEAPLVEQVATPTGRPLGARQRRLSIHIGFDSIGQAPAGLYANSHIWCRGDLVGPQGAPIIVHEYGHHIDATYAKLWPASTSVGTRLYSEPDFKALWEQSFPTIPSLYYARTSPAEWFAEAFATQIANLPAVFVQIAGGSAARAAALREAFTSRLPMPAFDL